ncbi:MAG: hypothetical protein ACSLE0_08240 [Chitinophagaceae bacterium]
MKPFLVSGELMKVFVMRVEILIINLILQKNVYNSLIWAGCAKGKFFGRELLHSYLCRPLKRRYVLV